MDEFKDFFKELKERTTSPFFGSFILSWSLINWPIVIAVFFKNNEKNKDRFTFVYETILVHNNILSFLIYPLIAALIYTFGYPYARRLIKWHIATQTAKSDSAILKSTGIATVSLDNYLIMKEAQEASQTKLSGLINIQQKVLSDIEKLKNELNEEQLNSLNLKQTILSHKEKNDERFRFSSISSYNGTWSVNKENVRSSEFWMIDQDVIVFNDEDSIPIVSFLSDFEQRIIAFQLRRKISISVSRKEPNSTGMSINSIVEASKPVLHTTDIDQTFIFKVSEDFHSLGLITPDNSQKFTLVRL